MAKIIIKRANHFVDNLRDYKVILNKEPIGVISNNSSVFFEIDNKSLEIYLKIDWCRSNKLFISEVNDELILNVEPNCKGYKIIFFPLYITLFKNNYLNITRVQ